MFNLRRREWPSISTDEIRKRARLLVIDDQPFPYEALFQRDGYNLEKWDDVERLTDIETGNYDLVLLDMQGIGRSESAEQGFGLLKHLKERCPTLIVVAYSNADWGLKYQKFLRLADAVLPKSADYVEFKHRVDDLLASRFSLGFYLSKIALAAEGYDLDPRALEAAAKKSILARDTRTLQRFLQRAVPDNRQVDRVLSIAKIAIGVLQLWSH
jgi:hypothetical protein